MIKNTIQISPTYHHASYNTLRTKGVERRQARMEKGVNPIKDSWEVIGCTLVGDGCIDWQSIPLVNTLTLCSQSVMHLSTIECMNITKSIKYLFQH